MSAKKARRIRDIKRQGEQVLVTLAAEDPTLPDEVVWVEEVPRHELIKAAVRVGLKPETDNGRWMEVTNEEIVTMIRAKFQLGWKGEHKPDRDGGEGLVHGEGPEGEGAEGEGQQEQDKGEGQQGQDPDPIPDGDGQHPDQPEEMQPEEFRFQPDPKDVIEGDEDLDTQTEKLKRQQEARDQQRKEFEEREAEKAEQREAWNNAERERRAEEQAKREAAEAEAKRQKEEAKADKDEFFAQFEQAKAKLEVPDDAHPQLNDILDALMLGHDVYLAGPAGTGKSFLTEQCAMILCRRYYSISFGPQTPESRLWGYHDAHGKYVRTPFREWYDVETANDQGAIFCGDEVDNGNTGITTTTNQALAGSGATFPDKWVDRHLGARMMCTANTWGMGATAEFMGRNPLDAAFLNRFTKFDIPTDEGLEEKLVAMNSRLTDHELQKWLTSVHTIRRNAETYKIRAVVSMRDAIAGAQLLSIGWGVRKVLMSRVLSGLPQARVEHLLTGVDA